MRKRIVCLLSFIMLYVSFTSTALALGEKGKTLTYKVIHLTAAGKLTTYTHYSIVAQEKNAYWLQRTTTMSVDSKPLSITQTLIHDLTHEPLRYIMHRPAKMNRPENVIDLPLAKMGQDEILPTPLTGAFSESVRLQLQVGMFDTMKGRDGDVVLWVSRDVPVLGVAKVETSEWTMELIGITAKAVDLFSKKPPKGGIVYLED